MKCIVSIQPSGHIELITASGQKLQVKGHFQAIGETKFGHYFVLTEKLHYWEEVNKQIQETSAVFVPKKSGELGLCIKIINNHYGSSLSATWQLLDLKVKEISLMQ